MVKGNQGKFQCEQCQMWFKEKMYAIECENWCKQHKSCNLDLIKHAVEE